MAKFMFSVNTGYVGSDNDEEIEIDDDEFDGVEEESPEYYAIVNKYYDEWLYENINTHWHKVNN